MSLHPNASCRTTRPSRATNAIAPGMSFFCTAFRTNWKAGSSEGLFAASATGAPTTNSVPPQSVVMNHLRFALMRPSLLAQLLEENVFELHECGRAGPFAIAHGAVMLHRYAPAGR